MKLRNLLEQVNDQASFLEFAKALQLDKEEEEQKEKENPTNPYSHGWNGWQNNSVSGFLESAIAYVEDSSSWNKEENVWRKFADFLYGGKIYE